MLTNTGDHSAFFICWFFSDIFSYLLFNNYSLGNLVIIIYCGVASILFFLTSDAQLLLIRKDRWMIAATILPALLFITAVYLMRKWINLSEVLILMFLSEFILSFAYWIGVKINLRSSTKEISI